MAVSKKEFEQKIYDIWATEIGLPSEAIQLDGNYVVTSDSLKDTNTIQIFKLGSFSYIRCGDHLFDKLSRLIQDRNLVRSSGISFKYLETNLPTTAKLEVDHIERVLYLHPDDFRPAPQINFHTRQLSETDADAMEKLKSACTLEEYEDSWVSVTDELAFGAFHEGELIACASMYTMWGFADPGILVHPNHRGYGIGKNLISNICEQVLQSGKIMNYRCTVDHNISTSLAQSLGFKQYFEIEVFTIKFDDGSSHKTHLGQLPIR